MLGNDDDVIYPQYILTDDVHSIVSMSAADKVSHRSPGGCT